MEMQQLLLRGEKIAWQGAPRQGLMLTSQDWFMIPFSLVWAGFAVFWEYSVINEVKAPLFFRLWGVPFVLIGLFLVLGRFFFDAWLRRRTDYAVTNQRIIIRRAAPLPKLTTLNLRQLPDLNLVETADGRGTIRFGAPTSMMNRSQGFAAWTPALDTTPQFIGVENAASLFNLINRASQAAQGPSDGWTGN